MFRKWIDPGSNEKMPFGKQLGMFSSMFWTGLQMAQKWIDPGSDQKMSFGEHLGVFSSMVWTGFKWFRNGLIKDLTKRGHLESIWECFP